MRTDEEVVMELPLLSTRRRRGCNIIALPAYYEIGRSYLLHLLYNLVNGFVLGLSQGETVELGTMWMG